MLLKGSMNTMRQPVVKMGEKRVKVACEVSYLERKGLSTGVESMNVWTV